jgi:hypothetical protein
MGHLRHGFPWMAGLLTLPSVAWAEGRSQPATVSDGLTAAIVVGLWLAVMAAFVLAWRWLHTEGRDPRNREIVTRLWPRRLRGRAIRRRL